MKKTTLNTLAITLPILMLAGCVPDAEPKARMQRSDVQSASGESYLLNSDDFDLEMVVGIVEGDGVKDIQALEDQINSAESGINNIDIDADGTIDYIMVKESREDKKYTLEFLAVPSKSGKEEDATLVGSVDIKQTAKGADVSGGYPKYVMGHDTHYYHRPGLSLGEAMFLSYMFMPRPLFYHPVGFYGGLGYRGRGYMSPSVRSSTRTSYSTTRNVRKSGASAKPKNYKPSPSAKASQKKFDTGKVKANPKDKALSSRNKQTKSYNKRSSSQSKSKASGFRSGSSKSRSSGSSSKSRSRSSGRSGGSFDLPKNSSRKIVRL
jgi:hypothetical protein